MDLYCAGHIHGGQIALPFYGALVTLSKYGKRFEAGLYRVGETWLYVNRGIGMEGERLLGSGSAPTGGDGHRDPPAEGESHDGSQNGPLQRSPSK